MQSTQNPDFDVVVIGAGFSGMYQLYRLRELGYSVKGIEAGGGVGGVWYWNRYPGCRVDSESYAYTYFWSERLRNEWAWSEFFAGQSEVLRYLNKAADLMDVRKDYLFNNRVRKLTWSEERRCWSIQLEDLGSMPITARFVISAVGPLTAVQWPKFDGIHTFKGDTYHTALWPRDEAGFGPKHIDFTGKRVGVVGTGSSGVQIIQTLGPLVNQMVVFQRTPNWCVPLNNRPLTDADREELRRNWPDIAARCERSPTGFEHLAIEKNAVDATPEEREALWNEQSKLGGYGFTIANYQDTGVDPKANALLTDYVSRRIRARIKDAKVADKLVPKDHGYGTRRVPMEKNYYEIYNQRNVTLVDMKETPVVRVTPAGITTTAAQFDLDVIIYATGFDAILGGITRLDAIGKNGEALKSSWADGPRTYLGLQVRGFPNFFTVVGPHNGASVCNIPRCSGVQVDWVTELFRHMKEHHYSYVEASQKAQDDWTDLCYDMASKTLMGKTESYFTGTNQNIPGRENIKIPLVWVGGNPAYREICAKVVANNYEGFEFK